MPVQSAFTLLIIGGAFSATGGLLMALNWLETGSRKRPVAQSHFSYHLQQRDLALKQMSKLK